MRKTFHIAVVLLPALLCATALAAPMAYSVNSDQPLGDRLHTLDLESGLSSGIGITVSSFGITRTDIEGLAIAPDLSLWGIDEDYLKLFRINTETGAVIQDSEVTITWLDATEHNDFGLTFGCDGTLYATSVISQSLYTIDESGQATHVGAPGALGVNISAIASVGTDPVQIFGLGNGLFGPEGPVDNRTLYEIDPVNGTTAVIGKIGDAALPYSQAGLSFDASGKLWAITDRSELGQFSQIISIDTESGFATHEATASILGFESLAIAAPGGCELPLPSPGDVIQDDYLIPSLNNPGKLLAILALMLTGFAGLRYRSS